MSCPQIFGQIVEGNGLTISVGVGGAIGLGIVWRIAQFAKGIRDDVKALKNNVWTTRDQERWAAHLEKRNRKTGLSVPDPLKIKSLDSKHGMEIDEEETNSPFSA